MFHALWVLFILLSVLPTFDLAQGQQVIVYEAGGSDWELRGGVTTVSFASLGASCSAGSPENAQSQAFVLSSPKDVITLQFTGTTVVGDRTAIAIYGATFPSSACDEGKNPTLSFLSESNQLGVEGTTGSAPTTTTKGQSWPPGSCTPYPAPRVACELLLAQYGRLNSLNAHRIDITTTGPRLVIFSAKVVGAGAADMRTPVVPSPPWAQSPRMSAASSAMQEADAAPVSSESRSAHGAGGAAHGTTGTDPTPTTEKGAAPRPGRPEAPALPGQSGPAVSVPAKTSSSDDADGDAEGVSEGVPNRDPSRAHTLVPIPAVVVPAVALSVLIGASMVLHCVRRHRKRRRASLRAFDMAASPPQATPRTRKRLEAALFWHEGGAPPRYEPYS
ncbi:hypothetical protein AURDEDRAFT_129370 [Auricularia subglabra TFB-10046 SS5]|uniref:Uncharacterized protein n=1 Tax=Auricularia subglabra (strain TFB-10046 / SS5) TaxID=717982 RepID=J0D081_AURST|nr:hypothetical protein AURDEDRAFT_129370 [Auricularia subglabra TFB-10046 SS5]